MAQVLISIIIVGCLILCGTANVLYAEEKNLKFDGSFQFFSILNMQDVDSGWFGISGRFGYRFSSLLFLDAYTSFYPGGGGDHGYRKIATMGGFRSGKRLTDKYGLFVNVRSGAIHFEGRNAFGKDTSKKLHGKTHPATDIGVSLEMYRSRDTSLRGKNLFFRIDFGNRIIFWGDTVHDGNGQYGEKVLGVTHNPFLEFGLGSYF